MVGLSEAIQGAALPDSTVVSGDIDGLGSPPRDLNDLDGFSETKLLRDSTSVPDLVPCGNEEKPGLCPFAFLDTRGASGRPRAIAADCDLNHKMAVLNHNLAADACHFTHRFAKLEA
jgi:hypothetical protein